MNFWQWLDRNSFGVFWLLALLILVFGVPFMATYANNNERLFINNITTDAGAP